MSIKKVEEKFLTGDQSRAARMLLHWTQSDLEMASGVSSATIKDLEGGRREITAIMKSRIFDAYYQNGIRFSNNDNIISVSLILEKSIKN